MFSFVLLGEPLSASCKVAISEWWKLQLAQRTLWSQRLQASHVELFAALSFEFIPNVRPLQCYYLTLALISWPLQCTPGAVKTSLFGLKNQTKPCFGWKQWFALPLTGSGFVMKKRINLWHPGFNSVGRTLLLLLIIINVYLVI